MDESDFGLSESNFSSGSIQQPAFLKANLSAKRERSATMIPKTQSFMSNLKNLILEDDEDLIDETEGQITVSKKTETLLEDDYSDQFD